MVSSVSSKKWTKTSRQVVKPNLFVHFLEETLAWTNHFKSDWPLITITYASVCPCKTQFWPKKQFCTERLDWNLHSFKTLVLVCETAKVPKTKTKQTLHHLQLLQPFSHYKVRRCSKTYCCKSFEVEKLINTSLLHYDELDGATIINYPYGLFKLSSLKKPNSDKHYSLIWTYLFLIYVS